MNSELLLAKQQTFLMPPVINPESSQQSAVNHSPWNFWAYMGADQPLETTLEKVLPWLGQKLACDRVFLYLRSPYRQIGRVPFCWTRQPDMAEVYDADWKPEPPALPSQDPMFAAALQAQPSLFIDDVKTASTGVVNYEFERQQFAHRALIHAHLCIEKQLWGILQPCVFDQPRQWQQRDRQLIEHIVGWLAPLAREYVNRHAPSEPR